MVMASCDGVGCAEFVCSVLVGACSVDVCFGGFESEFFGDFICSVCSC